MKRDALKTIKTGLKVASRTTEIDMRRFSTCIMLATLLAALLIPGAAAAANKIYGATALTGGGTGALDAIDGASLGDKDIAIVAVQGDKIYHYILNASSGASESSPSIISPDSNAGNKRWVLTGIYDAQSAASISSGPIRQNLITNSGGKGFVMSNGTLANIGSQVSVSAISAGVCTTTNTQGLAIGKLVTFGAGGSTANKTYEVTAVAANTNFTINDTSITDATAVTCYEREPQIAAASANAMDKWDKTNNANGAVLTRKFNSGLLDSIEIAGGSTSSTINWSDSNRALKPEFYGQFAGRTVTFGAWVKCSSASKARLNIIQSSGTTSSSYHTGGGAYEWIEISVAIASNTTTFYIQVDAGASTTTEFKQPMLIYGSSIGSGNYQPIPNELILFEKSISSNKLNGSFSSTGSDTLLNAEADSNGIIPKGVKNILLRANINDSGSASGTPYVGFGRADSTFSHLMSAAGITNDAVVIGGTGICMCNSDGDFYYRLGATGSSTLDIAVNYAGIQF